MYEMVAEMYCSLHFLPSYEVRIMCLGYNTLYMSFL